jgi:hypothetical protein
MCAVVAAALVASVALKSLQLILGQITATAAVAAAGCCLGRRPACPHVCRYRKKIRRLWGTILLMCTKKHTHLVRFGSRYGEASSRVGRCGLPAQRCTDRDTVLGVSVLLPACTRHVYHSTVRTVNVLWGSRAASAEIAVLPKHSSGADSRMVTLLAPPFYILAV